MGDPQYLVQFVEATRAVAQHLPAGNTLFNVLERSIEFVIERKLTRAEIDKLRSENILTKVAITRLERMQETTEQAVAELRDRVASVRGSVEMLERELAEPAVDSFIVEALEMGSETTSESIRMTLGRMIATRLTTPSDSWFAVQQRLAMEALRDMNERQLLLLARLFVLRNPLPEIIGGDRIPGVHNHASSAKYLETVLSKTDEGVAHYGYIDVRHLTQRGLIEQRPTNGIGGALHTSASEWQQMVIRWGIGPMQAEPWWSLVKIAEDALGDPFHPGENRLPLADLFLTPTGEVLGGAIVSQLLDERIECDWWSTA